MKLFFGGMTYDAQFGSFRLGRLKCYGEKQVDVGTSCSALKKKGEMRSGYYNIKPAGQLRPSLVFCDMESDTYTHVPQTEELSSYSPLGTILAWVPKPSESSDPTSLPDGWMFCNGAEITQGPWTGAMTPDLNNVGAFLRGGQTKYALEMEDGQIEDHHHDDSGHQHSCSASTSIGSHHHTYYKAKNGADPGGFCGTGGSCSDPDSLIYTSTSTTSSSPSASSHCTVGSVSSGLGGVSSPAKKGSETRPINMKVAYVIKVI